MNLSEARQRSEAMSLLAGIGRDLEVALANILSIQRLCLLFVLVVFLRPSKSDFLKI